MTVGFKGTLYRDPGLPKGVLAFRIDHGDLFAMRDAARAWMRSGQTAEAFSVKVGPWRAKRNLDQNALMWSLYEIEAKVTNGGRTGPGTVTPMDLYERDVRDYGRRVEITVDDAHVPWIREEYRFVERVDTLEGGKTKLTLIVSTSKMNTAEMAQWVDGLFDRLAALGIPMADGADVKRYWEGWMDARPLDTGVIMSPAEYRATHTICEATGEYLLVTDKTGRSVNVGECHHIDARGMGGDIEELKDRSDNLLMLTIAAHRFYHDVGVEGFVKVYPHLKRKIRRALKGEADAE